MHDWLSHRVAATPDSTALVRAADGEAWSYAALDRLAGETTGRLAAAGVEAGDRLGVLLPASVGYVGLIHATMRLGATLVPLGSRLTPRELSRRVERADPEYVVCAEETERKAVAAAPDVGLLSVDGTERGVVEPIHEHSPESVAPADWSLTDTLCILFTSGTTGYPKAVPLTAGNVLASAGASAFRLGVDPDDTWLVTLSLHHMGGLAPIYRSTLYGTSIVLREEFEPGGAADDIDRYDVTGVSLVPTMLTRMLDSRGTLSDSLDTVLLGGAPASEALIQRCDNYSIPVCPTYGMTETASQIATANSEEVMEHPGTVGRPLFGTDITVVDDDGSPVGPGETGEIVVSGPTVTPGYYDDPDATEAAFGEHGLATGDVGYRDDDGYLYVLNRRDDRIITGGENVEPGEVASVLDGHPAITDAVVVGIADEEWGERVAALLVPTGDRPEATELLADARDRLAGFKLPRTLAFTEEIPRTVSGTIDREAVRERLAETGFEPERPPDGFDSAGFEPAEPHPSGGNGSGSGSPADGSGARTPSDDPGGEDADGDGLEEGDVDGDGPEEGDVDGDGPEEGDVDAEDAADDFTADADTDPDDIADDPVAEDGSLDEAGE